MIKKHSSNKANELEMELLFQKMAAAILPGSGPRGAGTAAGTTPQEDTAVSTGELPGEASDDSEDVPSNVSTSDQPSTNTTRSGQIPEEISSVTPDEINSIVKSIEKWGAKLESKGINIEMAKEIFLDFSGKQELEGMKEITGMAKQSKNIFDFSNNLIKFSKELNKSKTAAEEKKIFKKYGFKKNKIIKNAETPDEIKQRLEALQSGATDNANDEHVDPLELSGQGPPGSSWYSPTSIMRNTIIPFTQTMNPVARGLTPPRGAIPPYLSTPQSLEELLGFKPTTRMYNPLNRGPGFSGVGGGRFGPANTALMQQFGRGIGRPPITPWAARNIYSDVQEMAQGLRNIYRNNGISEVINASNLDDTTRASRNIPQGANVYAATVEDMIMNQQRISSILSGVSSSIAKHRNDYTLAREALSTAQNELNLINPNAKGAERAVRAATEKINELRKAMIDAVEELGKIANILDNIPPIVAPRPQDLEALPFEEIDRAWKAVDLTAVNSKASLSTARDAAEMIADSTARAKILDKLALIENRTLKGMEGVREILVEVAKIRGISNAGSPQVLQLLKEFIEINSNDNSFKFNPRPRPSTGGREHALPTVEAMRQVLRAWGNNPDGNLNNLPRSLRAALATSTPPPPNSPGWRGRLQGMANSLRPQGGLKQFWSRLTWPMRAWIVGTTLSLLFLAWYVFCVVFGSWYYLSARSECWSLEGIGELINEQNYDTNNSPAELKEIIEDLENSKWYTERWGKLAAYITGAGAGWLIEPIGWLILNFSVLHPKIKIALNLWKGAQAVLAAGAVAEPTPIGEMGFGVQALLLLLGMMASWAVGTLVEAWMNNKDSAEYDRWINAAINQLCLEYGEGWKGQECIPQGAALLRAAPKAKPTRRSEPREPRDLGPAPSSGRQSRA